MTDMRVSSTTSSIPSHWIVHLVLSSLVLYNVPRPQLRIVSWQVIVGLHQHVVQLYGLRAF